MTVETQKSFVRVLRMLQEDVENDSVYLKSLLEKCLGHYQIIVLHNPFKKKIPIRKYIRSIDKAGYSIFHAGVDVNKDFKKSQSIMFIRDDRKNDYKIFDVATVNTFNQKVMEVCPFNHFQFSIQIVGLATVNIFVLTIDENNCDSAVRYLEEVTKSSKFILFGSIQCNTEKYEVISDYLKNSKKMQALSSLQAKKFCYCDPNLIEIIDIRASQVGLVFKQQNKVSMTLPTQYTQNTKEFTH